MALRFYGKRDSSVAGRIGRAGDKVLPVRLDHPVGRSCTGIGEAANDVGFEEYVDDLGLTVLYQPPKVSRCADRL